MKFNDIIYTLIIRYHLDCLTPQLSHVPIDDWHCPKCARERQCTPTHVVASVPQRSTRTTRRRGARTVAETATFARAARAWFSGTPPSCLLHLCVHCV